MRILIATGIFHPESGGPATYLYHILSEIQARGHEVTVLTFGDAPGADYPYPVVRISRKQSYFLRQLNYWKAARRLWPGHDVAFVHSLNIPLPGFISPRVMKIVGDSAWERATNKGWVAADTDIDTFQVHKYGLQVEINKRQRSAAAKKADHIIVPSDHRKNMVAKWIGHTESITVVYNALSSGNFDLVETAHDARRLLNLPDGPLLLTVARITPLKGIDYCLHALREVPGVRLVLAGDGPAREDLERLCVSLGLENRVTFLGKIQHEDIPLYFRAADYTLLYSGGEGLSHVLLESLRTGTPAIASDKGGNPEVIFHGINGLLVPYDNADALTLALREAFEPGRRDALAANTAYRFDRFDWDTMVNQTIEVLERTAAGG